MKNLSLKFLSPKFLSRLLSIKLLYLLLCNLIFTQSILAQECDPSTLSICSIPNANGFIEDAHVATYHAQVISTKTGYTSTGRDQAQNGGNLISFTPVESPLFPIPAGVRLLKSATAGVFETQTSYIGDDSIIYLVGGLGVDAMTLSVGASGTSFGPATFGLPTGVTVCDVDKYKGGRGLLALSTFDGDLYLMGQRATFVLTGTNDTTFTQVPMPAGVSVDKFALGIDLLFIQGSDGNFYTMGTASYLGDASAAANHLATPVLMTAPPLSAGGAIQILSGGGHYMVLDADGTIHVLGRNNQAQLGNNSTAASTTWTKVGTSCTDGILTGVKFIATTNTNVFGNRYTSHAILDDGSIIGWGLQNFGTLGNGADGFRTCPVRPCFQNPDGSAMPDPKNHVTVSGGGHVSPTITKDLKVCNVGHNADGAFGDGTAANRSCYRCIDSPPVREACVVAAANPSTPVLEKSIVAATKNADGSYDVDYEFTIETSGNDYCNISLVDDFSAQFECGFSSIVGSPIMSVTNTSATSTISSTSVNASFTGIGNSSMITPSATECLVEGDSIKVELSVRLNTDCQDIPSPLANNAIVTGRDRDTGATISDVSDDATDPDEDNIPFNDAGSASNNGTLLFLPNIEVDKEFTTLVQQADGDYELGFQIEVSNTGNTYLNALSLLDLLEFLPIANPLTQINIADSIVIAAGSNGATMLPTSNPLYDGVTVTELLSTTDGVLAPGENYIVSFNVEVSLEGLNSILPQPEDDGVTATGSVVDSSQNALANPLTELPFTSVSDLSAAVPLLDLDTDGDGIRDSEDLDSDNDGIANSIEFGPDTENPVDTDGDGVADYLDLDSDNDGIPDTIEAGSPDANRDGIVDCTTAPSFSTDGFCDDVDPVNGGTAVADIDFDGDGVPDRIDLDSDNDGIPDSIEAGSPDSNRDGIIDCPTVPSFSANGLCDIVDANNSGVAVPDPDTNGDGYPDRHDLDSDSDGISDVVEAGGSDTNGDGIVDCSTAPDFSANGYCPDIDPTNGGTPHAIPDRDGDGIPDHLEPNFELMSPFYVIWNAFEEQLNVVSLFNKSDTESATAKVTLIDRFGSALSDQTFNLAPKVEFDVLLNSFDGFSLDTYGIVKVEFSPERIVDGYSALYRFSPTNSDIEFSVVKEYANSITGNSYAASNTFQPSLAQGERNYAVIHWLQLANHNETETKSFTINRYDQAGSIFDTRTLTLAPLARFDTQTGHEDLFDGRNQEVSLVEVIPSDPTSPYGGELFRYGGDSNPGFFPEVYSFGLSDNLVSGEEDEKTVFVSTAGASAPYLEIYNVSDNADVIEVEVSRYDGTSVFSQSVAVGSKSQVHFAMADLVGTNTHAVATARSLNGSEFLLKATHYYYEPSGRISAATTRQGSTGLTNTGYSVHNTFLDFVNWLKLYNKDSVDRSVMIEAFDISGNLIASNTINLPAMRGLDVELETSLGISLADNSYGEIRITPSAASVIISDLVRTRTSTGLYTDFVKSLPIR